MKVIKQGDLSKVDTTRRFECHVCGCVWEATPRDYLHIYDVHNEHLIGCDCPTCFKTIWRKDDT